MLDVEGADTLELAQSFGIQIVDGEIEHRHDQLLEERHIDGVLGAQLLNGLVLLEISLPEIQQPLLVELIEKAVGEATTAFLAGCQPFVQQAVEFRGQ